MPSLSPITYWFAGRQMPPEDFKAAACARYGADTFDQVPHCRSSDSEGPGANKRGCLIGIGSDLPIAYRPKTYRWDHIGDGTYIGASMHAQPEDFLRPEAQRVLGVPVELHDGNLWYIPQANPLVASCTLPCSDALIEGAWQRVPADAFAHLSSRALDLADKYRRALLLDEPFTMDDAALRQLAACIISVNYDLTIQEMSVLRLFSADTWRTVIEAFIDWTGYQAVLAVGMAEAGTVAALDPPA